MFLLYFLFLIYHQDLFYLCILTLTQNFLLKNLHNSVNQDPLVQKKELKEFLLKSFESINEDFLILSPIFIPLIPGDNPEDKFNEEEHL